MKSLARVTLKGFVAGGFVSLELPLLLLLLLLLLPDAVADVVVDVSNFESTKNVRVT